MVSRFDSFRQIVSSKKPTTISDVVDVTFKVTASDDNGMPVRGTISTSGDIFAISAVIVMMKPDTIMINPYFMVAEFKFGSHTMEVDTSSMEFKIEKINK